MPDADLAVALKQARSKKMFFAFIPKGSAGKLPAVDPNAGQPNQSSGRETGIRAGCRSNVFHP
jgi:hypothetical protein